jgi:hypothetical protein
VRAILLLLSDDYVRPTSEDARKGGVVALAACEIGLKKADENNPSVMACKDFALGFLQTILPKLLVSDDNELFEDGNSSLHNLDSDKILQTLVTIMEHPDPFVRKVAMYWTNQIVTFLLLKQRIHWLKIQTNACKLWLKEMEKLLFLT